MVAFERTRRQQRQGIRDVQAGKSYYLLLISADKLKSRGQIIIHDVVALTGRLRTRAGNNHGISAIIHMGKRQHIPAISQLQQGFAHKNAHPRRERPPTGAIQGARAEHHKVHWVFRCIRPEK